MDSNTIIVNRTLQQQRDYDNYQKHKASGRCPKCRGKRKAYKNHVFCYPCTVNAREGTREKIRISPEKTRAAVKKSIRKVRAEVINHYGGDCACCGETFDSFLTIDHIGGGGNEHRRKHNLRSGFQTYYWLRKNNYPEGFRVLCWNCNAARAYFDKKCDPSHKNCSI